MAKPDSERGQYGAWVRDHRKRLAGNNIAGLTRLLEAEGIGAAPETIRGWEAGARPSDEALRAMERIFGQAAPELPPESALVAAAIDRLTAAVQAQTTALLEREDARDDWLRALLEAQVASAATRGTGRGPAAPVASER